MLFPQQVIEKQRAVVEFEVNEDDVDAHWYKDGIEINFQVQERHQYVVERRIHRMFISETRHSDAGEYTFVAGRNRSSVTLYVNGMWLDFVMFCGFIWNNPFIPLTQWWCLRIL